MHPPALKMMKGSCINQSLLPISLMPVKAIMPCEAFRFSCAMVYVAHTAATKHRQPVFLLQKLQASSIANKTPPTGAPKAAEIPALAPAEMNSR